MNKLLQRLEGGSLISDGEANSVADNVVEKSELLSELIKGLDEPNDVVRARTAHALERISRNNPALLQGNLELLIKKSGDKVPMVKWHIAMLLGNLSTTQEIGEKVLPVLFKLMQECEGVFVRSWSIVSLCVIGKRYPSLRKQIVGEITKYQVDSSLSIKVKIRKTIDCLENNHPIPKGWLKNQT